MDEIRVAQLLLDIFGGRKDVHAVGSFDGNNVAYFPVHSPLTIELLQQHLRGELILGAYHLDGSNLVNWMGWDIDGATLQEAQTAAKAILANLRSVPHSIEMSGGKGYHILVFLRSPISAEKAKSVAEGIRSASGLASVGSTHCETFPKQAMLTPNSPLGNLLKIPLGRHPRTHNWSTFVSPDNGWEGGPALDPVEILQNFAEPAQVLGLSHSQSLHEEIVSLLVPHWTSGERHQIALAVSGFLGNLAWGEQAVESLVEEVCRQAGDSETTNRLGAVKDTFRRITNRDSVAGYSLLAEILPGAVLRQLLQLATQVQTAPGVHRIDEIRMRRDSTYFKVRLAESTIWSELSSNGRFVKTENETYYLDREAHKLYPLPSKSDTSGSFLQILHKRFGINTAEAFGRQVCTGLLLKASSDADLVQVYRRFFWSGEKLYINLGGPEVYILDGIKMSLGYNGECGYIFESSEDTKIATLPTGAVDYPDGIAWRILVDNLSLSSTREAPASPEEQKELLKAWMLNSFFPELAPTKPLLLCLGAPGSGKTTAMRRILKVCEAWDGDVLELSTDKQDSLRASLTTHTMIVLDNLEQTNARWLVDILNRVATGTHIELRKLYSTNTVVRYKPNCFVSMTAVNVPFSNETVFDRMIPIEFERIQDPIAESSIQSELLESYVNIWSDLLGKLNAIVKTLRTYTFTKPVDAKLRMADFAMFCQVLIEAGLADKTLTNGLRSLGGQQQHALAANSPFVEALDVWLQVSPEDARKPHSVAELMAVLQGVSRNLKDTRWSFSTVQGLSRHIAVLEDTLRESYGAKVEEVHDGSRGKSVKYYTFRHVEG